MSHASISTLLSSRLWWAIVAGIATMAGLMLWRSYPWQLGLMAGIAVGMLVFFTLGTVRRLRSEFSRRP